jgi:hypothetical protein
VPTTERPVEKIVFFGRIELRKGLDRFLSAIEIVLAGGYSDFEVIFLGSLGQNLSEAELSARIERWTCKTRLLVNYTSHDAVDLLRTENCLAVIPSRVDNSPYTVYECLENGVPFIASDVGGISELVRDEDKERVLVSGEAEEYAARLIDALNNGALPARLRFDPTQADLDLISLHGNLVEAARSSRGSTNPAAAIEASVIVYGPGEPAPPFARVLRRWLEDGVEVLWDRGPPDTQSEDAIPSFAGTRAAALNWLARSASAEHLLFCHLSVTPRVEAPAAMLTALAATRADAIVCGYQTTGEDGEAAIVPVFGGPEEFSATRNVYGARLFLVRRARFLEAGGFAVEPAMAEILEWELLNRVKASGGRIFAVPAAMASVTAPVPSPVLGDYLRGRLAAPWTESAAPALQGFMRMALHPEGNAGLAAAGDKRAAEEVAPVPEVRGMDLASLLARRSAANGGSEISSAEVWSEAAAGGGGTLSEPKTSPIRLSDPDVTWQSRSLLNAIEPGESEENEIGRQNIAADGRLLRSAETYVIRSAGDAESCDFLVADEVAETHVCRSAADAFWNIGRQIDGGGERSPDAKSFVRLDEMLAACPDAAAPVLDAVRRATELTARFYCLDAPLYADLARIVRIPAGAFVMPRRPIPMPHRAPPAPATRDFEGLLCLNDDFDGGEVYFTSLDMAVKPRRGRYIGSTATPYHERAVLRVTSGTLLMLSFVMRVGLDPRDEGRPRLY